MKNIQVQIQNNTGTKLSPQYLRKIKSLALKILKNQSGPAGLPDKVKIGITFIDNKYIKKLNAKYRNINKPTDVIAFRIDTTPSKSNIMLGDIYISVERASQQIEPGETLELELARLVIHGTLHILGYDHSNLPTEQAGKMKDLEKHYFKLLL